MIFYDFEVFYDDWLVVAVNTETATEDDLFTVIVNDRAGLRQFWESNKDELWVGYNNTHYDQYIRQCILIGVNPKKINDWIIRDDQPGYKFDPDMKKFPSYEYDVMERNDKGLKTLEGYMGLNIKESSVPFDIKRKLTDHEIEETISYCMHDVTSTMLVFMHRQDNLHAVLTLIRQYDLAFKAVSRTKPSISAMILGASKTSHDDAGDITLPPTRIVKKYWQVENYFENVWEPPKDPKDKKTFVLKMAGMDVSFGIGGVHGAIPKYHDKGYFLSVDVDSLYPSLQLAYPDYCWSRNCPPDAIKLFGEIRNMRVALKKAGKKKEQAPYKILLNATYGITKDKWSSMYDPRQANNTCIFGMILVGVDLLERLEESGCCELIQVNTDGIMLKLNKAEDYDTVDDICYEWEKRTGLHLSFDDYGYGELFQKDVSNYLIVGEDGSYKAKGEWLKGRSDLDNDLPIVRNAIVEYFLHGTPVEKTINECDSFMDFQMIRKASQKYSKLIHGATFEKKAGKNIFDLSKAVDLNERCVRIYATKEPQYGTLHKVKKSDGAIEKVEGAPDHSRIFNDEVIDLPCPDWLDKQWYIDLARKRVEEFGVL